MVQYAELRLLLRYGEFRLKVDQVHPPGLRHLVAIFVNLSKVIAGIEENHRNIGQNMADKVEDNHVLCLEAVGDANIALCLFQFQTN